MAQQVINVGTAPNDGTGDPIRTAYIKTNSNFGELYNRVQTNPPASLEGSIGDVAGMYAYDSNYFYYCYANFTGNTQIWNQITNTGNISVTNIASGNSAIAFNNINGNALISVHGVSNVAVVTSSGLNIAGAISATGAVTAAANVNAANIYVSGQIISNNNITGQYFVGNGAYLTGITTTYGNSNVATYLPGYTGGFPSLLGNVVTTANISGAYILGNGSQLTGLPATYGNSNVAGYMPTYSGNLNPGNITAAGIVSATGNITGGNLTSIANITGVNVYSSSVVSATGNVRGGNINTAGLVSAAGNITGNYILGNGSQLTGIVPSYGNSNVATYLLSYTGNISSGNISASGNITGAYILGNGSQLTGLPATYGNSNVAIYLPTYTGNLTAGNVAVTSALSTSTVSASGNITGAYILGNGSQLTGIVSSYGNSNVASYLSTYTGNLTAGNITVTAALKSSTVSASGNITGAYILGNGSQLTGITASLSGNVLSANVTYTAPFTGSVIRTAASKFSDIVNVKDFGAAGNGTTDDTTAIQAAVNTGKRVYIPTGTYRLTDAITFNTPGQMFSGDGRTRTVFLVDNINYSFNLSASGAFVFSTGEPGPQIDNIGISFVQPTTSVRANLVAYPPAIYAQNIPRFSIYNCKITNAMTGIDMRQNSGGAIVDGLEMSCYSYGVRIDGSLDSVRIIRLQYWPFDVATANQGIFFDANNCGVESGRCDDLKIEDCLFINGGVQLSLINSIVSTGTTFGVCTDTDFDTYGYVNMAGGQMSFVNCYWTIGTNTYQAIVASGGILRVDSCDFQAAVALNNYMIAVSGSSTYTQITGCTFQNSGPNGGYITVTAGDAIINGNKFVTGANQTWTNALIYINGSAPRATIVNNRSTDKGTGTGKFVTITNDNWHVLCNNAGIGWGYTVPVSYTQMIYANNS